MAGRTQIIIPPIRFFHLTGRLSCITFLYMDKKDVIKPVRFTDPQIRVMQQAADKKKRKLTDWIRWCAVEASERVMGRKEGK